MVSLLENIKSSWLDFGFGTIHIIVLYLALTWIYLHKKDRKSQNLYLFTLFGIFIILALQVVSLIFLKRGTMPKMYYILPYALIIAYVATEIIDKVKLRKNKWILVALYAIIIQSGVCLEYTGDYLLANYNIEKISSTVIKMANYINSVEDIENPYLYVSEEIATQIQEYDVKIRVAYGNGYVYAEHDLDMLLCRMDEYGCNFFVVKSIYDDENYVKDAGYRQIAIFDGYCLYARK